MQSFVRYLLWSVLALAGLFLLWYFRSVFVFIALSGARPLRVRFSMFLKTAPGAVRPGNGGGFADRLVIWCLSCSSFALRCPYWEGVALFVGGGLSCLV